MKNKVNSKLEWIRNFFFDSRKDGADRIGVTANYLCQIETGTKVPRLKGLCKFSYHVPYDLFLSGDEKYFKTTAINILIDSMNTKEKEDLVNLLLQSIMRDRNRLGPK